MANEAIVAAPTTTTTTTSPATTAADPNTSTTPRKVGVDVSVKRVVIAAASAEGTSSSGRCRSNLVSAGISRGTAGIRGAKRYRSVRI